MRGFLITLMLLALAACSPVGNSILKTNTTALTCDQYETPIPSTPHYDPSETLSWGDRDLKILVVGHLFDLFWPEDLTDKQNQFIDFINAQDPDIVVLGGDSLHGPLGNCDYETLNSNWAALDAFKSRLKAKVLMVAGNHDGYGSIPNMYAASYNKFTKENKINYAIDVGIYGRHVGLFFFFEGDSAPNGSLIAPLMATASNYDQVLAFGGELTEVSGWPEALNESTPDNFMYFSGDYQRSNAPVIMSHLTAYNVTSYCPDVTPEYDANLITIDNTGVSVQALGNCGRY